LRLSLDRKGANMRLIKSSRCKSGRIPSFLEPKTDVLPITPVERTRLVERHRQITEQIKNLHTACDENEWQRLRLLKGLDFETAAQLFEANVAIGQQIKPLKAEQNEIERKLNLQRQ
jgi:hypothetical protein